MVVSTEKKKTLIAPDTCVPSRISRDLAWEDLSEHTGHI